MFIVNICDPDPDWSSTKNADAMIKWANENCKSFETHAVLDVSDFSMYHDTVFTFYFKEEKDATWFKIMWL